eukprot:TRINITY_DN14801_c1_g1_i2.p2 TRINITY_DN14801_c1_g1~~TRINITY_DN14801_c1_g1_i2.p2  ORF type:complete len:304 (-),score=21.31 TRINITY_DN14801_c1_g1_i2:857-1768(-)
MVERGGTFIRLGYMKSTPFCQAQEIGSEPLGKQSPQKVVASKDNIIIVYQTRFQQVFDQFGEMFPSLMTSLQGGVVDYNASEKIIQYQHKYNSIETEINRQQEQLRKIRNDKNSIDTAESVRNAIEKVVELQRFEVENAPKIKALNDARDIVSILVSSQSISSAYLKVQDIGIKPSKYVRKTSVLIAATQQFEKSVIALLKNITSILGRDVSPAQLKAALDAACRISRSERYSTSLQLEKMMTTQLSSSLVYDQLQKYEKQDAIFSNLKKSEQKAIEAWRSLFVKLNNFLQTIGCRLDMKPRF